MFKGAWRFAIKHNVGSFPLESIYDENAWAVMYGKRQTTMAHCNRFGSDKTMYYNNAVNMGMHGSLLDSHNVGW